ncbi:MAG: NAD(P)H-hydrate dehydratase [Clostridia bacterium]|nr:NAD(P)H-hydrate dehydratase [Clostridia bacterium]
MINRVLTSSMMREAEAKYMSDNGVTEIELVNRAARHVADLLMRVVPDKVAAFACGSGGNGSDGFTAARMYAEDGGRSIIILARDESALSPDARICFEKAVSTPGVEVVKDMDFTPDCWVDAMFGIGLKRPMSDLPLLIARRMNEDRAKGVPVIAVDIPSGLSSDSGMPLGECVNASHTVTFQFEKPGHLLGIGPDVCGETIVGCIGIPDEYIPARALFHPDVESARRALKPRPRLSHKGTFGHVLIIAGSLGMAGAAVMSAMAALRSGAGLVTVACPRSIVPAIQAAEPCAMCIPLPESDGVISDEALPVIAEALNGKSAVAIGPGLSTRVPWQIVSTVLLSGVKAIIDADAINIISSHSQLKPLLRPHHIITPHPGEAARLLGESVDNALKCANALAQMGATVILKGAASIIMGESAYISTTGCAGLAKGGSGDVLTGMVASLLAQGYSPADAGWIADTFHGYLGEITASGIGQTAMTSRDLIDNMKRLWGDGAL